MAIARVQATVGSRCIRLRARIHSLQPSFAPKWIIVLRQKSHMLPGSVDPLKHDTGCLHPEHPAACIVNDLVNSTENPVPPLTVAEHSSIEPESAVPARWVQSLEDLFGVANSHQLSWLQIEIHVP